MSQPTTDLHTQTDPVEERRGADEPQRRAGEIRSINSARATGPEPAESATAPDPEGTGSLGDLTDRLGRLERNNRLLRYALIVLALLTGYVSMDKLFPEGVIVQKTMLESKELKLLDSDGNPRLFLRMYSRVPVLQLVDSNGKPRLSLGLRFDDTPFIDLSDRRGSTRATLEMTADDSPALRLFDENGEVTFKIK